MLQQAHRFEGLIQKIDWLIKVKTRLEDIDKSRPLD